MRKLLLALCCFSALGIFAQQADYQKACAKYKKVQSVTAKCQRVRHRTVVAQDEVLYGTFQMVSPDKVNITMDGGKDALDMQGTAFTMTMKGKAHKTSSKTNSPIGPSMFFCSAAGINKPGMIMPYSGSLSRIKASALRNLPALIS